jgi:YesN/AraC family two-component response regulator
MIISISSGMPENSLQAFIEDYVLKLDTLINDKIHLGVSERGDKPFALNQLFQQSRQALQIGLLRQHSRVHYYEDVAPRSGVSINYSTIINRFGELSAANDRAQIMVFVNEITDIAQNEFRTYQNGINYYVKIVSQIINYLEEKYAIALESYLKENPYQQIWNCTTFGEMEDFLTVFFTSAIEVVQQHLTDISGTGIKVRKTIQVINEKYTDKSLNLTGVADIVKVNPSYLSRIFSREMGIPFQDYLTRIRVRRAKEMIINTDMPFYTISESVGFGSVLSFNRSFKKIEGANPKDFRKNR